MINKVLKKSEQEMWSEFPLTIYGAFVTSYVKYLLHTLQVLCLVQRESILPACDSLIHLNEREMYLTEPQN